jgi:hypothetical protein
VGSVTLGEMLWFNIVVSKNEGGNAHHDRGRMPPWGEVRPIGNGWPRLGKELQGWLGWAVRTAVIGMPATDRGRSSGEGPFRNETGNTRPCLDNPPRCAEGLGYDAKA